MMLHKIPSTLREHKYWCVWKGKKLPYNPKTNELAKSNNPDTFSDFETARNTYEKGNYRGLGIGIFDGICAIDIDHCIENEELSDMAKDIIKAMNSYTEISPSGTGIRIIFTVKDFKYNKETYYINNQKKGLEVYISDATNKYVTITGNCIKDTPIIDGTSALQEILDKYMRRQTVTTLNSPSTHNSTSNPDDIHFLKIGLEKDKKLKSYWYGDRPKQSESENDLGFMNKLLYWCNKNQDLALKEFFSSPYVSQKDEKHKKKLERSDYIMNLVTTAMPSTTAYEQNVNYRNQHRNNYVQSTDKANLTNNKTTTQKLQTISARDLQNSDFPPISFLVEDLLPEGTSILSASPKMGKSWFVLDMGLKIATGELFLNKKTSQTGVLYLALEDSHRRLKDRINKVLNNQPAPDLFHIAIEAPTLGENLLEKLDEYIKNYPDTKLIIIDTLQKVRGVSDSKGSMYQQDYADMGALKSFVDKRNLSLMIVHHNRKLRDPSNNFNMISGTNGIMGAADTSFIIDKENREDTNAKLRITGRDIQEHNIIVHFNNNTFKWEIVGDESVIAEEEKRREYEESPIVSTIKALLADSPDNCWKGTATQLIKEGKKYFNTPIATSPQEIGYKLNNQLDRDLFIYDKIQHKTSTNGNAGKIHHFYYSPIAKTHVPEVCIPVDDEETFVEF